MSEIISKDLLSEVLNIKSRFETDILNIKIDGNFIFYKLDRKVKPSKRINIYELAHKCIIYAWDKMYDISPSVMGTKIVCLKTGFELYIVQREEIENPKPFDPRFTFKALQWLLDNKGI